ncbi:MAG: ATP-binding cassette domain-containing protein [Algoriphagus sp.]|jgi:ABC-type multidrug transport system ATPase subunit|uniref:ABC transporter ATP-binding protein n=1 Tax=Algoriphagus sp. TaxID=1872435 RepID=UPI0027454FAD|nr:ATP-binding cassette domain-containing protein [Algoriphagus sp.]
MFRVKIQKASKRFQNEWVFKNLDLELVSGTTMAVTGGNGSGKSTFLKCLSGAIPLTNGSMEFELDSKSIAQENWFRTLSIATPYLELPEEFTLVEALNFHFQFKRPLNQWSVKEIIVHMGLEKHQNKFISQFSSGMKQRVKLALALFSEVQLILLDEPTSNLDKQGIAWYADLVAQYTLDRILVICSNEPREYTFCEKKIRMEDFK